MLIFSVSDFTFQSLRESSLILLTYGLSIADFAVEIRESYPSAPDISSGASVNGMRILPISIRREYCTRPPSSRWRIFIAQVHPHPVRDYAAQAVEPQTHVYGTVVEPVPVARIKAEHCSLISVPEDGRMSYFPGCASLCRRLFEVLLSGSFQLSVRHPSGTSA